MQNINCKYVIKTRMRALAIVVLCLGIGMTVPAWADQDDKRDLPLVDGETQLFPGYPLQFDGVGTIDRLGGKEIVISDDLLHLPSRAELHTPNNSRAGIGRFDEGDYVGYQLDEDRNIESLWLLQKGKR
ncbi:MAG: hypothetical protein QNJ22_18280 [Desulfosarcinaceae bacterium]|nr:hypothetical protein [Desulfosarcinaceae bacterium]